MTNKTPTDAVDAAWDDLFETQAMRCCDCPSCNSYLPHTAEEAVRHGVPQYQPDSECVVVTAIKRIILAERPDAPAGPPDTLVAPHTGLSDDERRMYEGIEDSGNTQGLAWRVEQTAAAHVERLLALVAEWLVVAKSEAELRWALGEVLTLAEVAVAVASPVAADTETAQCGHPNHGAADHDCSPFAPAVSADTEEHRPVDVYVMPDGGQEALLTQIEAGTAELLMRVCSACAPQRVLDEIEDGELDQSDGDAIDAQWPCAAVSADTAPQVTP